MLFTLFFSLKGITPDRILKYFKRPIHLSTCIRARAIRRVFVTPFDAKRPLDVNGGMFNAVNIRGRATLMQNPRSSMILWNSSFMSRKPQFIVIFLSDTFPVQRSDRKEMYPRGVHPKRAAKVALFYIVFVKRIKWCIVSHIIVQMDLPVDGVCIHFPKQDSFARLETVEVNLPQQALQETLRNGCSLFSRLWHDHLEMTWRVCQAHRRCHSNHIRRTGWC